MHTHQQGLPEVPQGARGTPGATALLIIIDPAARSRNWKTTPAASWMLTALSASAIASTSASWLPEVAKMLAREIIPLSDQRKVRTPTSP